MKTQSQQLLYDNTILIKDNFFKVHTPFRYYVEGITIEVEPGGIVEYLPRLDAIVKVWYEEQIVALDAIYYERIKTPHHVTDNR